MGIRPIRTSCASICLTAFSHRVPHPALLARLLLAPTGRAPHLRRSLLTPHSRQSCALPAPLAPRSGHAGPTPSCSTRRSLRQAKRPVPMVVVLARRRIPSRRPKLTGPTFPSTMLQMYISSVSDVSEACCNYFIWMLQSRVGCCTCWKCFRGMLQEFVQNVSFVFTYVAKCSIWMLHMLQ
jgi:hypothetical protein